MQFFSQLATQRLLGCKLQEKLRRVTWPLGAIQTSQCASTGHGSGTSNEVAIIFDCIHSNAVLVFKHIITSCVTKSTAGIRRVAKLDFISATTVATVARFYQTKTEKKTYTHCVRSLLFKPNHITFCLTANRPLPLLVLFVSPR